MPANDVRIPMRSAVVLTCLSFLLLSGCSSTSPSREASTEEVSDEQPDTVALSSEKLKWVGEEIESWVESGELVGAELLIVKGGETEFHKAFGWSHREDERPMQRNSIFPIKSMSKPITATAILMLADDGTLSLDDPVNRYVPNFPHSDVKIRHLLSHTSGITYDVDAYDFTSSDASLEDLVTKWPHDGRGKPLGTHSYNDYNFAALAYIVGAVSGKPVSAFFRERVFEPMGLQDTSTEHLDDLAWQARLNPWYRWNERAGAYEFRRSSRAPDWPGFYAGGWGVFSTCVDYAAFMGLWMYGGQRNGVQLLSEAVIREALEPQGDAIFYGYGWFLDHLEKTDGPSFWHGGGHDSVGIAFPADDALVVYLTQSRRGPHLAAFHNRLYLSGLFEHPGLGFRSESMVWAASADVGETELARGEATRYTGTYKANDREDLFVVQENGGHLDFRWGKRESRADQILHLGSLGNHRFALGRRHDGLLVAIDATYGVRFIMNEEKTSVLELLKNEDLSYSAERIE